jgi:hypothetical protein
LNCCPHFKKEFVVTVAVRRLGKKDVDRKT